MFITFPRSYKQKLYKLESQNKKIINGQYQISKNKKTTFFIKIIPCLFEFCEKYIINISFIRGYLFLNYEKNISRKPALQKTKVLRYFKKY